jgi:hypothetical protein
VNSTDLSDFARKRRTYLIGTLQVVQAITLLPCILAMSYPIHGRNTVLKSSVVFLSSTRLCFKMIRCSILSSQLKVIVLSYHPTLNTFAVNTQSLNIVR